MAASTLDKLTNTASTTTSRPQPTQVTAARSAGVFTLSCNALTGWPTDTKVHFISYKITTAGAKIAGSQIDMDGIVSGTSIGSITIRGGSDVGNAIGDIVEAAPTAAWAYDLNKWGTVHADSQGNLLTAAVQTALGSGSQALNGWNALAFPFNTVVALGNRSYQCTINSQDLTGTLSAGMRIRTQRTVVAPTQSTSLNGTNQYWSKTTLAGMTFTDDFTVMAWVKITSYANYNAIITRSTGATGFRLITQINTGQITLDTNPGGTGRSVTSYQSVPLNKWTHIAVSLDMSAGSAAIYMDGVLVPSTLTGAGTSFTQGGNLEIGGSAGGSFPLSGKIAQDAIFSAVLTQSTIQSYISQGLLGTETSLVSAHSFNGNANDLNTTNANNLTSNNGAVATTADSPFGGQGNSTISATLDYGIVQSATFSTNTTVILQMAEGCSVPTSGGVASVAYSSNKVPYLFPADEGKWRVLMFAYGTQYAWAGGVSNTWYNPFSLQVSVPIGSWKVGDSLPIQANGVAAGTVVAYSALSKSNTTADDIELVTSGEGSSVVSHGYQAKAEKPIILTSVTVFYALAKAVTSTTTNFVGFRGENSPVIIYADNAYL